MTDDRDLIPNPFLTENGRQRFEHRDVSSLSMRQLWAEQRQLETFLARRLWHRRRSRLIEAWPTLVDEHAWVLQRLQVLHDEQASRSDDDNAA